MCSQIFKIALYRSKLSCHEQLSLTISGLCYAGDREVACDALELGGAVASLIPWLRAVHQIFYALTFYGTIATLLFLAAADNKWCNPTDLKAYRIAIIAILIMGNLAGIVTTVMGFGTMIIPSSTLKTPDTGLLEVQMGWAQVVTIFFELGMALLLESFTRESQEIVSEGGAIVLDEETGITACPSEGDVCEKGEGLLVEI